MDATSELTFRSPLIFWLLGAVPFVVAFLIWREGLRRSRANRFASESVRGVLNPGRIVRPFLEGIAISAAVVALSGPQFGYTIQSVPGVESSLVILLDTSLSMSAEDVGTSRLSAARALTRRVIASEPGRVGLVVFEGSAEVLSPLTDDVEAVSTLVESIGAGELSEAGSDLGEAISVGLEIAKRGGKSVSAMLLISDGEDRTGGLDEAVQLANDRGVEVFTVLIGGAGGATIPVDGTDGRLQDEDGEVVVSVADSATLREIAGRTHGRFFENPFSDEQVRDLMNTIRATRSRTHVDRETKVPIDRYQWPLSLSLIAFVAGSFLHRGAE